MKSELTRRQPRPAATPAAWRGARPADLPHIHAIATRVHPALPERPAVLAEKLALFPAGCFVLNDREQIVGYALAHPWRTGTVPPLDTLLGELPRDPDSLYVHDVALLPEARGHGQSAVVMKLLAARARQNHLLAMALVAVYGTHPHWRRLGFTIIGGNAGSRHLSSYGPTAQYMVKDL
jgi:GNAT superfamily N-acetyltransferase